MPSAYHPLFPLSFEHLFFDNGVLKCLSIVPDETCLDMLRRAGGLLCPQDGGIAFDAEDVLSQNPQWNWQQGYLRSPPVRPWALFDSA